jgi:hypothetical protein
VNEGVRAVQGLAATPGLSGGLPERLAGWMAQWHCRYAECVHCALGVGGVSAGTDAATTATRIGNG